KLMNALINMQSASKVWITKRREKERLENCQILQNAIRRFLVQIRQKDLKRKVTIIQNLYRTYKLRQTFALYHIAAVRIQVVVRCWIARNAVKKRRNVVENEIIDYIDEEY